MLSSSLRPRAAEAVELNGTQPFTSVGLHPQFPSSPYSPLVPEHRWFPAAEELRGTAYEKLLPTLVAKIREEVHAWTNRGYPGTSATSLELLQHWFETEHLIEQADHTLAPFRYYFAQREAVETVIWLHEVRRGRDRYDLLRFDASSAVSSGMFRRLAAVRSQTRNGHRQDEGPLAPHCLELLSQALRTRLGACAQFPRYRAQHHRP